MPERDDIARNIITEQYARDDDVVVYDDAEVESVDGGYWVAARHWVYADDVEDRLAEVGDGSSIEADPKNAQRRGL